MTSTAATTSTRHWTSGLWSAIACLLFLLMAVQEVMEIRFWRTMRVLEWDAEAYYHYLPATFIRGDVRDLAYVADLDDVLHPNNMSSYGLFHVKETGHDCIKYTYGTALFEAPLFFAAHAYCHGPWTAHPADGYSAPYQLGVSLSSVAFVFLGLWVLRRFLLRHVADPAAALALITVALGTNVFFIAP